MRLTQLLPWLLLCGVFSFVAPASAQTARVPGRIVVAKLVGNVTGRSQTDGSVRELKKGDELAQQTVVTTGAGSSVILVFSNGASLNLGADSSMSIDEFLQDPFSSTIAVAELTAEPTSSQTKLNLTRGELVGNVKKLNQGAGSSFTINTPVGAAGIRGTTFRIVFRPDASGKVFFTLSTAEGSVLFEAPAAEGVAVETGKEVVVNVEVEVDPDTGTVTVTSPPEVQAPQDIPVETRVQIEQAAQDIVTTSTEVIVTSVTNPDNSSGNNGNNPENDPPPGNDPPADNAPPFTPPPPPPNTTPGDGL